MIVFDVLQMVAADALTSDPKGTYAIEVFATRAAADEFVSKCQRHTSVKGVAFTVDDVDELDPKRYPTKRMIQEQEQKG